MIDVEIRSLPDYLEQVFVNKQEGFYHEVADLIVMFRGQANYEWMPLPSVFRTQDDFLNEHFYIREYERQMPHECAGKSSVEILIDAQHYGIPTRLLDVTSNALVALYFACGDAETKCGDGKERSANGVVIQFRPAGAFMYNDLSCIAQAEYVRRYKDGIHFPNSWRDALIEAVRQSDGRFSFDARLAVEHMLSEKARPFFFLPKYSNDRISAQQGAFLLCLTPFVKRHDPGYGEGVFMFPDEVRNDYERLIDIRYIIPAEIKQDILVQLDSIGVNEARLFPDTEHRVKTIVSSIRRTGVAGGRKD